MAKNTQIASRGVEFQLNPNPFTRTGYSFDGWALDWTQASATYADEARVTFDGDRDLYALWKANTYYVSFSKNSSDATGTMSNETFTYDEPEKALTANAFARTGYSFTGWATEPTGGAAYSNGQPVYNLTSVNGATIPLYAVWNINQYTATFVHNDGTGNTTEKQQNYGTSLTAPALTRTGYTLSSWNPEVPSTMPDESKTYTAQWSPNTYKVTLDNQGATTAGTPQVWYKYNTHDGDNYYYTNSTCTNALANSTITKPEKTGFIFGGYWTGTGGSGTQYVSDAGVFINNIWSSRAENTILYAKWIDDEITITFDSNGGYLPEEEE